MLNLENEIVKLFKEDKKVGIKFLQTVKLSEEFIIEFAEKLNLDWFWISANQDLSNEFITKFSHKIDWKALSRYKKFTNQDIDKFKDKIDWKELVANNKNLKEDNIKFIINNFTDEIDWESLVKRYKYNTSLYNTFKENKDRINWARMIYNGRKHKDPIPDKLINYCIS